MTEIYAHNDTDPLTRQVRMPDGTMRNVCMTPRMWDDMDFLQEIEGITPEELVPHAFDEVETQPGNITFDFAFRIVVAHLAGRWT